MIFQGSNFLDGDEACDGETPHLMFSVRRVVLVCSAHLVQNQNRLGGYFVTSTNDDIKF